MSYRLVSLAEISGYLIDIGNGKRRKPITHLVICFF